MHQGDQEHHHWQLK